MNCAVLVTPNVWWFYWVALGWGFGLAFTPGAFSAGAAPSAKLWE